MLVQMGRTETNKVNLWKQQAIFNYEITLTATALISDSWPGNVCLHNPEKHRIKPVQVASSTYRHGYPTILH